MRVKFVFNFFESWRGGILAAPIQSCTHEANRIPRLMPFGFNLFYLTFREETCHAICKSPRPSNFLNKTTPSLQENNIVVIATTLHVEFVSFVLEQQCWLFHRMFPFSLCHYYNIYPTICNTVFRKAHEGGGGFPKYPFYYSIIDEDFKSVFRDIFIQLFPKPIPL